MIDAMIIGIAKYLASYAIGLLAKRLGVDQATSHVMQALENAKPIPPDPDPSPASLRDPPRYKG